MAGVQGDRALLDCGIDHGAVCLDDLETQMKLEGAKVVVVGMARSGVAAVELLREQGAHVRAVDQNPVAIPELIVEPQTEASFADADLIVLSPGVPAHLHALEPPRSPRVPATDDL